MTNKEAVAKLQAAGDIAIAAGCELAKIPAIDVLAIADLLTEHEPVKPIRQEGFSSVECGKCNSTIPLYCIYCPFCGRKVLWNA